MLRWCVLLCDRIFSVAGAVVFSQIPEFIQQYSQRLSGHINELSRQVMLMQKSAEISELTLGEYIQKFLQVKNDNVFVRQGEIMQQLVDRYQDLSSALASISDATLYSKPFAFSAHLKTDIALDTWHAFKPAIPTTLEGLIYAFIGMLFGITVFYCLKKTLNFLYMKIRRWKRNLPQVSPPK